MSWYYASGAAPAFTANTAVFDGSSSRITGNVNGRANTATITASAWVKFGGGDGALQHLFGDITSGSNRFAVRRAADNTIQLVGANAGGTQTLNCNTTNTVTTASGWTHIYVCVDMNTQANTKVYLNGVAETLSFTTYTTGQLGTNVNDFRVGAGNGPSIFFNGTMAELWLRYAYLDSPAAFRSGSKPADIGATGSTPATPALYLSRSGSGTSWPTDSSGGGTTFTQAGTALTAGTAP